MTYTLADSQELAASSPSSPQTTAIDTGTRTNGLLIVKIWGSASNIVDSMAAAYAGQSMTKDYESNFSGNDWFWCFSIEAPDDGSDNLVLTFSVQSGGVFYTLYWVASWYDGADQTSPFDGSSAGSGSTDPSVDHTPGEADCLMVGMYKSEANSVLTVGSGETLLQDYDAGTRVAGASYAIQSGGPSQHTFDWSGQDEAWYAFVCSYAPAGGGTQYQQAAAGTLAPSGAASKETGKLLAGSLPAAGVIRRFITKPTIAAGGFSPAGSLAKQAGKILAGALTPSGVADGVKIALQAVAGALAPAGSLVRQPGKVVAGVLAPAGSLVKEIRASLSGSLAPAGAVAREIGKLLAGSLTPAGSILKGIGKLLAGVLSTAGALAEQLIPGVGATGLVNLSLWPRDWDLELNKRDIDLTLVTRETDLTLEDRDI